MHFFALTFIIMIAVVLLADSMLSAVLIISLLVNFLIIASKYGQIARNELDVSIDDIKSKKNPAVETSIDHNAPEPPIDMYGPFYEMYHSYHTAYTDCYDAPQMAVGASCAERSNSVDAQNTLMAQRRARDKKCSDGWVTKDANYYKHHFGSELDDTENRVWWGRNEF